jgi:hypothetical protein
MSKTPGGGLARPGPVAVAFVFSRIDPAATV